MENKVLIKLIVPELENTYDVFIPVNEIIWKIKKILIKCVSDLSSMDFDIDTPSVLINRETNKNYSNNEIVINTDIRNGSELILVFKKQG